MTTACPHLGDKIGARAALAGAGPLDTFTCPGAGPGSDSQGRGKGSGFGFLNDSGKRLVVLAVAGVPVAPGLPPL